MDAGVSEQRVRGNGRTMRILRLAGSLPILISRGLSYPGKRAFLKRLVNTYQEDRINLSLVFRRHGAWRLRWLALRAVGVYLGNLLLYNAPRVWRGFDTRNAEALARATALGKGVVVAVQHLGPHRYSFAEAAGDLKVWAATTEVFVAQAEDWVRRVEQDLGSPGADAVRRMTMLAVEQPTCALKMMRALRRKDAVVLALDGNIGVGGEEQTVAGSFLLSFLGRQVHVRQGVAFLGYRSGAPILPVIAVWGASGRPEMRYFEPIQAGEGEGLEEFSERCLTALYALLEAAVLAQPHQWEMWPHFYKWLTPPAALGELADGEALEPETRALSAMLERTPHSPVAVRPENAHVVRIRGRYLFVDAVNCRFFFVSAVTQELLKLLHAGSTLERLVRRFGAPQSRQAVLRDLARFRRLNLLEIAAPLACEGGQ